jgi:hypothetical protein
MALPRTDATEGLVAADVMHDEAGVARVGDSVAPDAPAATGLEVVLASATRRVPVVDADGAPRRSAESDIQQRRSTAHRARRASGGRAR